MYQILYVLDVYNNHLKSLCLVNNIKLRDYQLIIVTYIKFTTCNYNQIFPRNYLKTLKYFNDKLILMKNVFK